MRRWIGWAIALLGVLSALLGLAVMIYLGPDSRRTTGPHTVKTSGIAVVTAPKVISWADVQIDVLVEVPVRKPIFVGLGNTVDVQNLLGRTTRLEVTSFGVPWKPKTREINATPALPGAPTALDWWLADSAGLGGAAISTTLPDQSVSLAILSVGDSNLSGLKVTLAYGIRGGFAKGAGLALLGIGAISIVLMRRRGMALWRSGDTDDEWVDREPREPQELDEVSYVYVDEDGVEHQITAEEAEQYEIVEEVVEEVEVESEVPAPEPSMPQPVEVQPVEDDESNVEVAPEAPAVVLPVVMTAAQIAGAAEPEPEPVSPDAAVEKVVYVFVDEDGVEHEVSADELDEFEVVDEEEDR